MRIFDQDELTEAVMYASNDGGQALHLHTIVTPDAPACFVRAVRKGEKIGHLFDLDESRLVEMATRIGVRRIVIHKRGTDAQHIDLCGSPLARAVSLCMEGE